MPPVPPRGGSRHLWRVREELQRRDTKYEGAGEQDTLTYILREQGRMFCGLVSVFVVPGKVFLLFGCADVFF